MNHSAALAGEPEPGGCGRDVMRSSVLVDCSRSSRIKFRVALVAESAAPTGHQERRWLFVANFACVWVHVALRTPVIPEAVVRVGFVVARDICAVTPVVTSNILFAHCGAIPVVVVSAEIDNFCCAGHRRPGDVRLVVDSVKKWLSLLTDVDVCRAI